MIDPPIWTRSELQADLIRSREVFREERLTEPLEEYLEAFDRFQGQFEELMERTIDLTELDEPLLEALTDPTLLDTVRYLAGPPISSDDLKILAEAETLSPSKLRADPVLARRLTEVVLVSLDRRRFPWVREEREPTDAERATAVIASSALMATQRAGTARRHQGKNTQEQQVAEALRSSGFVRAAPRPVETISHAPDIGQYSGETVVVGRKADFVVRLWDGRVMPIECKVSNSALNSVKRLNNDAAVKAEVWRTDLGRRNVVPTAVLGGVYNLRNLEDAQNRGLTLFWAHALDAMAAWIESTRPR
jgi:hypothetical protein